MQSVDVALNRIFKANIPKNMKVPISWNSQSIK